MAGVNKKYRTGFLMQIFKGYIFLPPNLEDDARTKYIQTCYRTGKVSVLLDGGGVAHNVPIDKNTLKEVNFPESFGEAGDSVLCWLNPYNNRPMVFALFNKEDESTISDENEYKVVRSNGNNISSIDIKGNEGEVYINVDSDDEDGGNIVLNVNNVNRNGSLKINVNGEADIYTSNKAKISSNTELELTVKNLDTDNESSLNITGEKHVFNDAVLNSFIADINKLVEKINIIESDLNTLKEIIRTDWTPVAQDGGAALKLAAATWYSNIITETEVDDIKDSKIEN